MSQSLTIIIPCYNCSYHIEDTCETLFDFLDAHVTMRVVFADDCSSDDTVEKLKRLVSASRHDKQIDIVQSPENRGKGGAISLALDAVRTDFVCYTDVDLAYDLSNIERMREEALRGGIAVACRVHPESQYLIRPHAFKYIATRHVMSRFFNLMMRFLLIPGVYDVQAGLKASSTEDMRRCVARITKLRFSFDTELLVIAHAQNLAIHQVPVRFKFHTTASSVNFTRDGLRMLRDLVDIKFKAARGLYR